MLLFDRRDHLHTAGDFYRVDGQAGNRGAWQRDEGQFNTETYVFSACGGAAVYRRSMLNEIGLFGDDFFFSPGNVGRGWPVHHGGWGRVFTPEAAVSHH